MKKKRNFDQNHGLTHLQKINFYEYYIRSIFLWVKEACFLARISPNNILQPFYAKDML